MIYLLFYKNSFTQNNKIYNTLFFGTILYILIHIILTFSGVEALNIIKQNYFKLLVFLDLVSVLYMISIDNNLMDGEFFLSTSDSDNDNLNSKINSLKKTIYNIIGNHQDDNVISFPHNVQLEIPQLSNSQVGNQPSLNLDTNSNEFQGLSTGINNISRVTNIPSETQHVEHNSDIQAQLAQLNRDFMASGGGSNIEEAKSTSIKDIIKLRKPITPPTPMPLIEEKNEPSETLSDAGSNLDLNLDDFSNSF